MTQKTFVFFGIAGSGKGTQVDLLKKYLNSKDDKKIVYAYPGNEFRKIIAGTNHSSMLAKDIYNRGALQPDFLTIWTFGNVLYNEMETDAHLIVDGFPRSILQAESLATAVQFYDRQDVHLIYIKVGEAEATKRMKLRARADDTDDAIKQRFQEYMNNVIPALNFFKDKGGYIFDEINGEQSIEAVHAEIMQKLNLA